ncbi:MAG: hypothetical protein H0X66_15990 [Verrucomicrobia bacterium]|nr:hypothetical protein [Verrucomicrobiota bacterium]
MASIAFYALKDDIRGLFHFIFEETDFRVFESYSAYDAELREFRSYDELSDAFALGLDAHGHGHAVLLRLWSSTVTQEVEFERISLKVPGHSFRYRISGIGLVQLYLGGEHAGIITDSHYGHWNEAGARQRSGGNVDSVNWDVLSQVSGRLQRHLRNRMAVAKVRGRPILPAAFAALQRGVGLRYSTIQFHADSPEIQLRKRAS